MKIISINLGRAQPMAHLKAPGLTGIDKRPAEGDSVEIGPLGLVGDAICDASVHGGADQAVYVYGALDLAAWEAELGRTLSPGVFGENLTVSDLVCADLAVGDRLLVGALVLEVTAPRIPCATLAHHMGDPGFVKRFRHAERPGVYCRVIQGGHLTVGTAVQHALYAGDRVGVIELFRDAFTPTRDPDLIRRYLAAPLAERMRRDKDQQLAKVLRG